jgi:ferredoxin
VVASGADGLSTESEHERRVKEMNRVEAGARLSCLARVVGDVVVTARYW